MKCPFVLNKKESLLKLVSVIINMHIQTYSTRHMLHSTGADSFDLQATNGKYISLNLRCGNIWFIWLLNNLI